MNGRSAQEMMNNGWWPGIRLTRWVPLLQKQHVTQATGSPTCTRMTMCTLIGKEGPYSFTRVYFVSSLIILSVIIVLLLFPKLTSLLPSPSYTQNHILICSDLHPSNNVLSIHPSTPSSLSRSLSQYEYGPVSLGCTCRSVALCHKVNLLNLLWSRQVWPWCRLRKR